MKAFYRFIAVFLLLPLLSLTGCGSDSTDSATGLLISSSNTVLDVTQPERFITITATVRDASNNLLPNATVRFSTTLGSFSATGNINSVSEETGRGGSQDAGNGVAAVKLYPGPSAGTATITAFVNGYQQSVSITINGPTGSGSDNLASNLTLVASNPELDTTAPERFVTLTATVRDKDNNLLHNAAVLFSTSLGSFSSSAALQSQSLMTVTGVATVRLYPGQLPGTARVTAFINGLQQNLELQIKGADLEQPTPSAVTVSAATGSLSVTGTAAVESAAVLVQLLSASGLPARDGPAGVNNVRLSLLTKPNGGEYIKGFNAAGAEVQSQTSIDIASKNGIATVQLQAGTLPGIVQLKAEALNDGGQSYNPAILSQTLDITISAGPAHSLVITYPENAMTNLNNGSYRKRGTVLVTDRYGNPVSDGTAINFGVLDSVISSNISSDPVSSGATIAAGSAVLTAASGRFTSAAIQRNNVQRFIEPTDRLLLPNTKAADKSRFVAATPLQDNQLSVSKNYLNSTENLQYLIGASLLGTQVSGVVAGQASPVNGRATTVSGAATFYITYPANSQTLLAGCPGFENDTRYQPEDSVRLWLVAEAADSEVVTVNNTSCMHAISPLSLSELRAQNTISTSTVLELRLQDAGGIRLPFVPVQHSVSYETNTEGFSVQPGQCQGSTGGKTDAAGICYLPVSISGGTTGSRAQIQLTALDSRLTIQVVR